MSKKHFNPAEKPPANVCPKEYCFHWVPARIVYAPGFYENLEDSMKDLRPAFEDSCAYTFDRCTRLGSAGGDGDRYEPCESELNKNDLPWFYFIPSPAKLIEESKEKYIRESEALWGNRHWEKS